MLTAYRLVDGVVRASESADDGDLPEDALWVDLLSPTDHERSAVERTFGQVLPSEGGMAEIEATSRCFQDEGGTHVRSYFLHERHGRLTAVTAAFVVTDGRLFTLRRETSTGLQSLARELETTPGLVNDPFSLMLRIFEAQIDWLADVLEDHHRRLEDVTLGRVEPAERSIDEAMRLVAAERDVNDTVRLSLMDKERALSYLLRRSLCPVEHTELLREILRDIESLNAYSAFQFDRVDALMREIVGRIGIEQNRVIKLFSVAAVVLLPPTLVASIYGMNFDVMPELGWPLGYPLALLLMLGSAVAPYLFFRHKGWL